LCFCHDLGDNQWETRWRHPDSGLEAQEYDDYSHRRFLNQVSFEALSYTWGDPADREEIVVVSEEEVSVREDVLSVGRNLAQALRHLRYETKSRTLWVDAICINQDDEIERSQQVRRASLIYEEARQVIVWLGLSTQESDVAISALKELGRQVVVTAQGQLFPAPGAAITWLDAPVTLPYSPFLWSAINSLLCRPWFTRVWVLQEVLLSHCAQFVCGKTEITCPDLGRAMYFLKFQVKLGEPLSRGLVNSRMMVVFPATISTWTITGIVRMSHEARCTIDKDAIYGAFGLFPESFRSMMKPDYTLSTKDVYTDFVRSHIAYTKRLEILHMCGMRQHQRLPGLPSWVPDFFLDPPEPLGLGSWHFSAGHSACDVTFLEDDTLEVAGVLAATVLTVSEAVPNHEKEADKTFSDTLQAIGRIRAEFEMNEPDIVLKEGSDAFGWSLLGSFVIQRLPEDFTPGSSIEALRPMLRASPIFGDGDGNSEPSDNPSPVEDFCLRMLMGKRVIKTGDGHWGIAPAFTRTGQHPSPPPFTVKTKLTSCMTGDIIVCLLGAERPNVIRKTEDQKYTIIGECFLPEAADMRSFLGPLPHPWEVRFFVENMEGAGNYRYFNSMTGELTDQDPRLGPLPEGVEVIPRRLRTGEYPRIFQTYRNHVTGVEEMSDPRLTSAALQSQGIHIQRFLLK
jgi:hypothetical protein